MLVMHFYLVCNMNKIVSVFVVCILIFVTTGADESISKYKTSTTTTKWKKPTTTPSWKESTTATNTKKSIYLKTPNTTIGTYAPKTTSYYKETTVTTKSKPTTTTREWKQTISSKTTPSSTLATKTPDNHGVIAVASFAGTDSRNGRRSSMNRIKIFPSFDSSVVKTDDKGNFVLKSVNGKVPMPITITKEGDGVSGTIRILPGSVSVSSSASSSSKSGPVSAFASYNPWKTTFMKPSMNDIYLHPFSTFPKIPDPKFDTRFADTSFQTKMLDPFPFMKFPEPSIQNRIQDPWFENHMFKQPRPRYETFQSNWFYPSYTPLFNYW